MRVLTSYGRLQLSIALEALLTSACRGFRWQPWMFLLLNRRIVTLANVVSRRPNLVAAPNEFGVRPTRRRFDDVRFRVSEEIEKG